MSSAIFKECLDIFAVFFKIGALTFGGGYTMLPLLQADIAGKRKWAAEEDIIDFYAISQSLPGIVAVNTSMLIGYKKGKIPGLVSACLGMMCPSIIIILAVALFIKNLLAIETVGYAFNGIRVAVAALIVKTAFDMGKKCLVDGACVLIFVAALLVFTFVDISPVIPVLTGGIAGIVLTRRRFK
ncbi:MAG: chromate transporter [Synergistaceae bacterium]|jgi:chromate transporter|nr:chromate transporter [Synergistaceae bacterium]